MFIERSSKCVNLFFNLQMNTVNKLIFNALPQQRLNSFQGPMFHSCGVCSVHFVIFKAKCKKYFLEFYINCNNTLISEIQRKMSCSFVNR